MYRPRPLSEKPITSRYSFVTPPLFNFEKCCRITFDKSPDGGMTVEFESSDGKLIVFASSGAPKRDYRYKKFLPDDMTAVFTLRGCVCGGADNSSSGHAGPGVSSGSHVQLQRVLKPFVCMDLYTNGMLFTAPSGDKCWVCGPVCAPADDVVTSI